MTVEWIGGHYTWGLSKLLPESFLKFTAKICEQDMELGHFFKNSISACENLPEIISELFPRGSLQLANVFQLLNVAEIILK